MSDDALAPGTLLAQGGGGAEIVPSINPATTYSRDRDTYAPVDGRVYSRDHCPNYDLPEQLLATLEGAQACLLFSSGIAAADALLRALLKPGDCLVLPRLGYFAIRKHAAAHAAHINVEVEEYTDLTELEAVLKKRATDGGVRLVWVETPANPTWEVVDINAVAALVRTHCPAAEVVVDATALTPLLCQPLKHGAHYVMHSATKYLNGHSDVVAGAVCCADSSSAGWTASLRMVRRVVLASSWRCPEQGQRCSATCGSRRPPACARRPSALQSGALLGLRREGPAQNADFAPLTTISGAIPDEHTAEISNAPGAKGVERGSYGWSHWQVAIGVPVCHLDNPHLSPCRDAQHG